MIPPQTMIHLRRGKLQLIVALVLSLLHWQKNDGGVQGFHFSASSLSVRRQQAYHVVVKSRIRPRCWSTAVPLESKKKEKEPEIRFVNERDDADHNADKTIHVEQNNSTTGRMIKEKEQAEKESNEIPIITPEMEQQVLASAQQAMDYKTVLNALSTSSSSTHDQEEDNMGDDGLKALSATKTSAIVESARVGSADDPIENTYNDDSLPTSPWQVALAAAAVVGGGTWIVWHTWVLSALMFVGVFGVANQDPLDDDTGGWGAAARLLGRYTLQQSSTAVTSSKVVAKAAMTGQAEIASAVSSSSDNNNLQKEVQQLQREIAQLKKEQGQSSPPSSSMSPASFPPPTVPGNPSIAGRTNPPNIRSNTINANNYPLRQQQRQEEGTSVKRGRRRYNPQTDGVLYRVSNQDEYIPFVRPSSSSKTDLIRPSQNWWENSPDHWWEGSSSIESSSVASGNIVSNQPSQAADPRIEVALAAAVVSSVITYALFANVFGSALCFASMFALSMQDPKPTKNTPAPGDEDDTNTELLLLSTLAQSLGESSLKSYNSAVRPKIKAVAETVVAGSKTSSTDDSQNQTGNQELVWKQQIRQLEEEKYRLLEGKKQPPAMTGASIQTANTPDDMVASVQQPKDSEKEIPKPAVLNHERTVHDEPNLNDSLAKPVAKAADTHDSVGQTAHEQADNAPKTGPLQQHHRDFASVAEKEAPNYTLGVLQQMADDFGLPLIMVNSQNKQELLMHLYENQVLSPPSKSSRTRP